MLLVTLEVLHFSPWTTVIIFLCLWASRTPSLVFLPSITTIYLVLIQGGVVIREYESETDISDTPEIFDPGPQKS